MDLYGSGQRQVPDFCEHCDEPPGSKMKGNSGLDQELLPFQEIKAVAQWLKCCATSRKVDGSIPAGVIENFH